MGYSGRRQKKNGRPTHSEPSQPPFPDKTSVAGPRESRQGPRRLFMSHDFYYSGFKSPNTTQVPDELFDVLLPELSDAELRVLLYIIRRTFGFKKDSDTISLRQMVEGITTRDGRVLDRGTGLKKSAVANALNGLERKGIILSQRNQSRERGHEPTTYALHVKHHPLSVPVDKGMSTHADKGLSVPVDTQYTVVQHTEEQQTDKHSTSFDRFAIMQQDGETSKFSKKSTNVAKAQ